MNRYLIGVAALWISACADIPDPVNDNNSLPTLELTSPVTTVYPGSDIRINFEFSDEETAAENLALSWQLPSSVELLESNETEATLRVALDVEVGTQLSIQGIVTDGAEGETRQALRFDVAAEPIVLVDAETREIESPDQFPLYLYGAVSAKRKNLKSVDSDASTTYFVSVSPNGQFALYLTQNQRFGTYHFQLFDNATGLYHSVTTGGLIEDPSRDLSNTEVVWSDNSAHAVIISKPLVTGENWLHWLNTPTEANTVEITARYSSVRPSKVLWSDSLSVDSARPVAAIIDESGSNPLIHILDPADTENPIAPLEKSDSFDLPYTEIKGSEMVWRNNQLFYIASVTETIDTTSTIYNLLYKWGVGETEAEAIIDVDLWPSKDKQYEPLRAFVHSATRIAYLTATDLIVYDGRNIRTITLTQIPTLIPNSVEVSWAQNGQRLLVKQTVTEGADTFERISAMKHDANQTSPLLNWAQGTDPEIIDWAWNQNHESINLLTRDTGNNRHLYFLTTDGLQSAQVLEASFGNSSYSESVFATSPTGRYQIFYTPDVSAASQHIDLFAYDVIEGVFNNITRLAEPYSQPRAAGVFEEAASVPVDIIVEEDVRWLSDHELVVKLRKNGEENFQDLRYVNLLDLRQNRSLISEEPGVILLELHTGQ